MVTMLATAVFFFKSCCFCFGGNSLFDSTKDAEACVALVSGVCEKTRSREYCASDPGT